MPRVTVEVAVLCVCLSVGSVAAKVSSDSLEVEVARLDTVGSVYDPLVRQLTDHAQPAVPLLVEKLQSPRRLTALSSAWAIGKMADERNFPPLLEAWAKAKNETLRSEAITALSMTLRGRKHAWRNVVADSVDPDVQLLLIAALCPKPGQTAPAHGSSETSGRQPLVFGDQLGSEYALGCFEEPVEAFQMRYPDAMPESTHGRKYVSFHCDILDIAEPSVSMPEWKTRMGCLPTSLAFVFLWRDCVWPPGVGGLSGSGREALWVKCGGRWFSLGTTYAVMS